MWDKSYLNMPRYMTKTKLFFSLLHQGYVFISTLSLQNNTDACKILTHKSILKKVCLWMTRSGQGFFFKKECFSVLSCWQAFIEFKKKKKKKSYISKIHIQEKVVWHCTNALNHLIKMHVGLQHRDNKWSPTFVFPFSFNFLIPLRYQFMHICATVKYHDIS